MWVHRTCWAALGLLGAALLGGCDSLSARQKGPVTGGASGAGSGSLVGTATTSTAGGGALVRGALGGHLLGNQISEDDPSRH